MTEEIAALREMVAAQEAYMAMQRVGRPNERTLTRMDKAKARLAALDAARVSSSEGEQTHD